MKCEECEMKIVQSKRKYKYYCERCGEEDLVTCIESDLRPFDIYCGIGCIEGQWDDIESGDWGELDDEYDEHDLKKYYRDNKEWELWNKDCKKWIAMNCSFLVWNDKTKKYDEVEK